MCPVLCDSFRRKDSHEGGDNIHRRRDMYGKFVHMWKNFAKVCAKLETVFVKFATRFRPSLTIVTKS